MSLSQRFRPLPLVAVLATAFALGACSRSERDTAEAKIDETVAKVEQKADQAQADASRAYEKAKDAGANAMDKAGDKVADAAITTAVNAELAKDSDLSALQINVDTVDGKVLLKGNAPTQEARERATRLASAVDGVRSVDNTLVVNAKM